MQSFIQYLIEARYSGDHPLVAKVKKLMSIGDTDTINVGEYKIEEIVRALTSGFGKPDTYRDESAGQLGEAFWDFEHFDVYYLFTRNSKLKSTGKPDPQWFNVYVDRKVPND